jgi:elongation factor P
MNTSTYEQYELPKEQVGDAWQFLKDGLECTLMVYNNNPIAVTPPNHVVLRVEYAEPTARGNTATNVQKPVKLETGAEILAPAFVNTGDYLRIDTRTGEYIERSRAPEEYPTTGHKLLPPSAGQEVALVSEYLTVNKLD